MLKIMHSIKTNIRIKISTTLNILCVSLGKIKNYDNTDL